MPPIKSPTESKGTKNYFRDLLTEFLDLDHGVDKWGTINEIKSKQSMSGANAWMLMCSIMIASIGLNLNSQAVIIGAMLISPLMSPILGIGTGIAINDRDALKHALMHFGAAIIIALVTSTLYFSLTPFNEFTPEIEARTSPTFLDILIAIFGGIAGIVSIARKDISTTLPGVAIATALMPPLCVTGYGIANGSFEIMSRSFYLFFLNTFFVALATYVIIRQMKFPHKEYASNTEKRKNLVYIAIFSLLMIIPSVLIFRGVYEKYDQQRKLKYFIENSLGDDYKYLDDHELFTQDDGSKTLVLKVYGDAINKTHIPQYREDLSNMGLGDIDIEIIATSEINLHKIKQLETQLSSVGNKINTQIAQLISENESRQSLIENMENQSNFFRQDSTKFGDVCKEVQIFFPDIEEVGLAISMINNTKSTQENVPTIFVKWPGENPKDRAKLEAYLKNTYNLKEIKLIIDK